LLSMFEKIKASSQWLFGARPIAEKSSNDACMQEDYYSKILHISGFLNKAGIEFSNLYKKELLSIKAMCADLQKKHEKITKENSKLIEDLSESEVNLSRKSYELQDAFKQLSEKDLALKVTTQKLNETMKNLVDARVRLDASQVRAEKISDEHAQILLKLDQQSRELLSTKSNLESLSQQHLELSGSLDSTERRVSEAEARARILDQELDHCTSLLNSANRIVDQNSGRIADLERQGSVLRKELENKDLELAKIEEERVRLQKELDQFMAKLEESSRKYDAKVDGLSKMKIFLTQALEAQRKQTTEVATKLSQSERANNNLTAILEEFKSQNVMSAGGDAAVDANSTGVNSKNLKIVPIKGGGGSD
jgi:chromosome segregation ATPase